MENQYRAEYNFLRDTNQLKEISKSFKGEWQEDKELFIKLYQQNLDAILNAPLTIESIYDEDNDEYIEEDF